MVIVEEDHDWYPFFSTDPNATPVEIIEAFADRATLEQDFHDVKEVWGAGQQQVQNIWTNLAVYHLNPIQKVLYHDTLAQYLSPKRLGQGRDAYFVLTSRDSAVAGFRGPAICLPYRLGRATA